MEHRYELKQASREERHRGMREVTKMFHHGYFHWCKVVALTGMGGVSVCHLQTKPRVPHAHTHVRTNTHVRASAALILNTPLAIIIFI